MFLGGVSNGVAAPDRHKQVQVIYFFFLRKNIILNWHWMCCEGEKGLTWTEECICWREQVGFMLVNDLHLTSITVMGRRRRHYKSKQVQTLSRSQKNKKLFILATK